LKHLPTRCRGSCLHCRSNFRRRRFDFLDSTICQACVAGPTKAEATRAPGAATVFAVFVLVATSRKGRGLAARLGEEQESAVLGEASRHLSKRERPPEAEGGDLTGSLEEASDAGRERVAAGVGWWECETSGGGGGEGKRGEVRHPIGVNICVYRDKYECFAIFLAQQSQTSFDHKFEILTAKIKEGSYPATTIQIHGKFSDCSTTSSR
jgi:hypothetical protein